MRASEKLELPLEIKIKQFERHSAHYQIQWNEIRIASLILTSVLTIQCSAVYGVFHKSKENSVNSANSDQNLINHTLEHELVSCWLCDNIFVRHTRS